MKLIQSETVFYDYSKDTAESVKTIVHETSGAHHIRDALLWFRASSLTRVRAVPDNDDVNIWAFARMICRVIDRTALKDRMFCSVKSGVVTVEKFGGGQHGRAQDVCQANSR